uniref:Uncharacterized protein n=1 Tax=Tanacetum cinerariifolium TaxID=118510 RepID=A0A6L2MB24_TANCI|nr:hypothetical protein [Tanacetum cinerariifolium]
MRSRYKLLKWLGLGDEMGAELVGFGGVALEAKIGEVWGVDLGVEMGLKWVHLVAELGLKWVSALTSI